MRWNGIPPIPGKPHTSSVTYGDTFPSRGRLGLPLVVSELVHLFRDAIGLCQSVDSIRVFNTGDDTCGSFTCFCILFSREKRMCPRGMSAKAFVVYISIDTKMTLSNLLLCRGKHLI